MLILGSACVEIFRDLAHWESGIRCVGSWGRTVTARESLWEQKGLLSMFNMMQVASVKSDSVRGAYHQSAFIGVCLPISHTCLPCLPSR